MSKQKECQLSEMNIKELETLLKSLDDKDSHLIVKVRDLLMIKLAKYRVAMENLIQ